ncbi:multidrug efflux MFS transporter MdtH [soil metagenome]
MVTSSPHRLLDAALIGSLTLISIGGGLFIPLSLVFFVELTDIPLPILGLIISAAGLTSLPVPIVAGRLADRFGARTFVIVALALQSAAFLGFSVAREPLAVLTVSIVMALGSRLYWSTIFAALADYSETSGTQSRWFAIANIARTAGIAVGGLLTGLALTDPSAERYVTLALAAAGCLAGSAFLMALTPTRVRRPVFESAAPALLAPLRNRPFVALLLVNTVFACSTMLLGLALPTVVAVGLRGPGALTAALLVGNAILIAALGLAGARWASRRNALRVLAASAAIWAVGCAFLSVAAGWGTLGPATAALVLAVAFFSLAEIIHAPTSLNLASGLAPPAERGTYLALFQYSFVIAEIVLPALFAGLFTVHHSAPFVLLVALNLAMIPALVGISRLKEVVASP